MFPCPFPPSHSSLPIACSTSYAEKIASRKTSSCAVPLDSINMFMNNIDEPDERTERTLEAPWLCRTGTSVGKAGQSGRRPFQCGVENAPPPWGVENAVGVEPALVVASVWAVNRFLPAFGKGGEAEARGGVEEGAPARGGVEDTSEVGG